ncbi:MAG: flagellar protein FlaG [Burkholderiaceae bacterium]|nr:MAG: flagellar protein FlaG [Burkholderiaceae bacterium]
MNIAPVSGKGLVTTGTASTYVPPRPTVTEAAVPEVDGQVDTQRLQAAVDQANRFMQGVARNLEFSIDHDSGKTIVKVIDSETQKVVRQIPSEEMMAISRALGRLKGVMVEQHA